MKKRSVPFENRAFALEATTGFEPVIRELQSHALPLGYVAIFLPPQDCSCADDKR